MLGAARPLLDVMQGQALISEVVALLATVREAAVVAPVRVVNMDVSRLKVVEIGGDDLWRRFVEGWSESGAAMLIEWSPDRT